MAGTATISWIRASNPAGLVLGTADHVSGNGNALSHSLTGITAGSLLVIMTSIGVSGADCTVTSSPSLTWTKRVDVADTSAEIHTATFSAGGSITVSPTWNDATPGFSVCQPLTGQETTPAGASKVVLRSDAPFFGEGTQGDITTTRAGSIIFGVVGDRADVAGTITYVGSPTQIYAQQVSVPFFYSFYKTAASVTTYTLGLSSPNTGAAMGMCLYEIRVP